ncbi:MAG: cobalamin biosynthesis bifunctional protein CbiET [Rhodopirellula sp. TMED11]|nr:MAG: cobalamin biosynthesis bifunctional protein CbiET [Rhodopirellula sp. TMED11]
MTAKIYIVGMGDDGLDGLTGHAKSKVHRAEVIVGSTPLLQRVPADHPAERIVCDGGMQELESCVESLADRPTVMLAGGDPLFYGIARFLTDRIGKNRFEIIPHVSSMQLAFARVKESWDDAFLTNLAVQPLDRVVDVVRAAERVGMFTTEEISPSVVAESLLDRRIDYFNAYVCENLGTPNETITAGDLASIRGQEFSPLNVMVLVRRTGAADLPSGPAKRRLFGNPDDYFLQSRPKRGLLTPCEVRCIALAELEIQSNSVVWDVGAGSGALAIEAAAIAREGAVYAIEMDVEDYNLMIENAQQFNVPSLIPVHGQAPDAWAELPDPDAVFVGGSGRMVPELVAGAISRLKDGRIVVNVSSPDNLVAVQAVLAEQGFVSDVRMINISRGLQQLDRVRFEALNPSFLVIGYRESAS